MSFVFIVNLFIYLFLAALSLHCCILAFSSRSKQELLSNCSAWASHCSGFSCCGAQAQQLWVMGLVASQHVKSSQTRDKTHVPRIGRRILNHWITREAPGVHFLCDSSP